MEVLVLNSGSSSVKFDIFDMSTGGVAVGGGVVERIGEPGGSPDHRAALSDAAQAMRLSSADLVAIGHRVVHGGSRFQAPALIDSDVLAAIEELVALAPLHNPANLAGIAVTRAIRPDVPQVAVFDTAFHATIPAPAATYAIDTAVANRLGIRRYGFHGSSHAYVSRATAALLDRPLAELNIITLHLGNGASACAVAGGRSVETSMGLTPQEGLVMGTRSGDLDPGVLLHLLRNGYRVDDLDQLITRHSGLAGLCGENDLRAVLARRAEGDAAAALAFGVYVHRIRKYVGAYCAVLGHVDAVTFTGGVGENAPLVREAVCANLEPLGIATDPLRNNDSASSSRLISPAGSPVAVCVVPTDEELEIARQTMATVLGAQSGRGR